jgi:hypothetical protein
MPWGVRMQPMYRKSNSGATLVAVLLVVMLVSVLGAVALRQGMSGLKQVGAEQILRMQRDMNNTVWNGIQRDATSPSGKSFGSLLYTVIDTGYEVVFCYKPTKAGRLKMFALTDSQRIRLTSAGAVSTTSDSGAAISKGFCNINKSSDSWNSGRKISVTQVHARRLTERENSLQLERLPGIGSPLALYKEGTGLDDSTKALPMVRFVITTLTLGITAASTADINTCLQERYADNLDFPSSPAIAATGSTPAIAEKKTPEAVAECLTRIGVPAQTLVTELLP